MGQKLFIDMNKKRKTTGFSTRREKTFKSNFFFCTGTILKCLRRENKLQRRLITPYDTPHLGENNNYGHSRNELTEAEYIETIGIEKRDDKLATLYDILFDDELYNGIVMFTETRRCYRLTKQAFISISYGLSLQNGLSNQGNVQAARKQRKPDGASAEKDWRLARSEISPQKGTASKNRQTDSKSILTPNTVSRFFSAYLQPNAGRISSLNQHAKEESDAMNLKPQNPPMAAPQPQSLKPQGRAVDAEFQAMWNQLQQKLPPTAPPVNPPQPPPPTGISSQAVSEQTNALRKLLKIREDDQMRQLSANPTPVPRCGHVNSCVGELTTMVQRLGLSFKFYHKVDPLTGEISGVLTFSDGVEFIGPKCSDSPKASESVACLAVTQYPAILAKRSATNSVKTLGIKGGPSVASIPAVRVPFPQGIISMGTRIISGHVLPRPTHPPPLIPSNLLPTPPQQWCLQDPRVAAKLPPPVLSQEATGLPRPNLFVPLQAQTAAILKDSNGKEKSPSTEAANKGTNEVVPPQPQQPLPKSEQPLSCKARSRRGRLAAKFSTPLDN